MFQPLPSGAVLRPASDSAAPQPGPLTVDPAALERLRGGLRIIALRALGDADAAEDVVQETLSRALVALEQGRLNDPAKLGAYVAGIARHICSHIHRDRKNTIPIDDADTSASLAAGAPHRDALEALISEAEHARLRAAFDALPGADQQLLRLCFHEDRSPGEVAAALAEPAERVRKRKSRALERLRRAFLGHDAPPGGTDG